MLAVVLAAIGSPAAHAEHGLALAEDLVYMLHRCGCATGINLAAAIAAGRWLQEQLGRPVPGMLVKAGDFPATATRVA